VGSVVSEVPQGPGATETKTLDGGYDDTYAAWYLNASNDEVGVHLHARGWAPRRDPDLRDPELYDSDRAAGERRRRTRQR
jgi:hypothetical protein